MAVGIERRNCMKEMGTNKELDLKDYISKIDRYVKACFKDAYEAEGREDDGGYLRYILICTDSGERVMIVLKSVCKYDRVLRRVNRRLSNNLHKNFGIYFKDTDRFRSLAYKGAVIDPNYTEYMFRVDGNKMSLSIFDDDAGVRKGEVLGGYRYEKLLMCNHGISADELRCLYYHSGSDKKPDLDGIDDDWNKFNELYVKTFPKEPLGHYKVVCSDGVERL